MIARSEEIPIPSLLIVGLFAALGFKAIQKLLHRFVPQQQHSVRANSKWTWLALVMVVLFLLPAFLSSPSSSNSVIENGAFLKAILLQYGLFFLFAIWAWLVSRESGGVKALGFRSVKWQSLAAAAVCYVCFLPIYLFTVALWNLFLSAISVKLPPQAILEKILSFGTLEFSVAIFTVVLLGPFFEEFFFRTFFQTAFETLGEKMTSKGGKFAKFFGIFCATLVFALGHDPIAWFPIFVFGFFLGLVYRRSGSIWVPLVIHALHNALMVTIWILLPNLRSAMGDR